MHGRRQHLAAAKGSPESKPVDERHFQTPADPRPTMFM
jgi:hypothetical protein